MPENVLENGVLRKSRINPRYFQDGNGKLVLLTGSHTWANLQELFLEGDPVFDYDEYLSMMAENNHNFMRMWQWGHPVWTPWTLDKVMIEPLPYMRSGGGVANDGLPKFNLTDWNEAYFERMRERVVKAGKLGIYVSIMFFDGWCLKHARPGSDPWVAHPYNKANNVNDVHGDSDNDGFADIYTLDNPLVTEYQKAFMRKVIDTVNDLDNVLFEIINEIQDSERNLRWHYHMVDYVKQYEALKPKQHPVGMTDIGGGDLYNTLLFESNADWISPGNGAAMEYQVNPPAADGSKVIILDTDHLWGHGGSYDWVWKSFLRGHNPIFMDPWCPVPGGTLPEYPGDNLKNTRDYPEWDPIRRNMGYIRQYAEKVDMGEMIPNKYVCSSGFCLEKPGEIYMIYFPEQCSRYQVDLRGAEAGFSVEWFDPVTGSMVRTDDVQGGQIVNIPPPFSKGAFLFLRKHES